jgi:hypothetical protein
MLTRIVDYDVAFATSMGIGHVAFATSMGIGHASIL